MRTCAAFPINTLDMLEITKIVSLSSHFVLFGTHVLLKPEMLGMKAVSQNGFNYAYLKLPEHSYEWLVDKMKSAHHCKR